VSLQPVQWSPSAPRGVWRAERGFRACTDHDRLADPRIRRSERVEPNISGAAGESLLKVVVESWETHLIYVEWMRKLFMPLDKLDDTERKLLPTHGAAFRSRTTVGLMLFRDTVFARCGEHVMAEIMRLVNDDRESLLGGERGRMDRGLLKSVSSLFVLMGIVGQTHHATIKDLPEVRDLAAVSPAAAILRGPACAPSVPSPNDGLCPPAAPCHAAGRDGGARKHRVRR